MWVILFSFLTISNSHSNIPRHFNLSITMNFPEGPSLGQHLHKPFLGGYMNLNLKVCVGRTGDPWMTFSVSKCSVKEILGRGELKPAIWKTTLECRFQWIVYERPAPLPWLVPGEALEQTDLSPPPHPAPHGKKCGHWEVCHLPL